MNKNPMQSEETINICGVLIHAHPGHAQQVQERLMRHEGVEVHAVSDDSKLVVTIEHGERRHVVDTLTRLNNVEGVLSAAMVYQHSE